jgi:hypothetical protein
MVRKIPPHREILLMLAIEGAERRSEPAARMTNLANRMFETLQARFTPTGQAVRVDFENTRDVGPILRKPTVLTITAQFGFDPALGQ